MKTCTKCGEPKGPDGFYTQNSNICAACRLAYQRARYYEKREELKAKALAYHREHPEIARAGAARYKARNPDKVRAHGKVRYALRSGRLQRGPCENCGAEPAHAHHDDYHKPLEVRWLCLACHRAHHRTAPEAPT